jgi:hypothetical protein
MSITGAVALQLYKFLDQMKGVDMTSNCNGKLFWFILSPNIFSNSLGERRAKLKAQIKTYRDTLERQQFSNDNLKKYFIQTLKNDEDEIKSAGNNVRDMIRSKTDRSNNTFDRRFIYRSSQVHTLNIILD